MLRLSASTGRFCMVEPLVRAGGYGITSRGPVRLLRNDGGPPRHLDYAQQRLLSLLHMRHGIGDPYKTQDLDPGALGASNLNLGPQPAIFGSRSSKTGFGMIWKVWKGSLTEIQPIFAFFV